MNMKRKKRPIRTPIIPEANPSYPPAKFIMITLEQIGSPRTLSPTGYSIRNGTVLYKL